MRDHQDLPITPDFDPWPMVEARSVEAQDGALRITWADGEVSLHHPLLLAENDPADGVLHPLSRETLLSPTDFPEDLAVTGATVLSNGAIEVAWSHGRPPSQFHPGWLRGNAWFGEAGDDINPVLWTAKELPEPPSFDGPAALENPALFRDWLTALRDYGVARLTGLPNRDGLLVEIGEQIGTIRASNFGKTFTLEVKDDPDSNAYTSHPLPGHIDLPTRECSPGLQVLFCRENSTTGGEGTYADAYRIAEDIRAEEPEHFAALAEINWTYNNRAKTTSYKATGPVVDLDAEGRITSVRYNTWLRAPLVAPLEDQDRAYKSYRAFAKRAEDPRYQMLVTYRAGDLFAFDNRRALHGRRGYNAQGGARFIEGFYSDRDDLYSAIRMCDRQLATEV